VTDTTELEVILALPGNQRSALQPAMIAGRWRFFFGKPDHIMLAHVVGRALHSTLYGCGRPDLNAVTRATQRGQAAPSGWECRERVRSRAVTAVEPRASSRSGSRPPDFTSSHSTS